MGYSVERMVRDRMVNDATMRGFFSATLTSSARVYPAFMEVSGQYPLVTYSETPGPTTPGLSACDGIFSLFVEAQATAGVNPYVSLNNVLERIDQLFDDQVVTGLAVSGTAVYACLVLREGGVPVSYDAQRKTYQKVLNYSYRLLKF